MDFAVGTWNLTGTENFDEYMKTIGNVYYSSFLSYRKTWFHPYKHSLYHVTFCGAFANSADPDQTRKTRRQIRIFTACLHNVQLKF